jgi:hypothetical protein
MQQLSNIYAKIMWHLIRLVVLITFRRGAVSVSATSHEICCRWVSRYERTEARKYSQNSDKKGDQAF